MFFDIFSVEDASGRFTNGFYWGNSFFMGSATECNFIGMDYGKSNQHLPSMLTSISSNEVREFTTEPRKKKNHGLSGDSLLSPTVSDIPPFKIGFYMIKINLNGTINPTVCFIIKKCLFSITQN